MFLLRKSFELFKSVLLIHSCITNYAIISWLKTTNIPYLTISMGQKSRRGLAGSSGSRAVMSLINIIFADRIMVSSAGLIGRRVTSKSTPVVVGRIRFLVSCWTKNNLLALRQKPPLVPNHMNTPQHSGSSWQLASLRWVKDPESRRERVSKTEAMAFL